MDVVSVCPLRVASLVWQPRAGAYALTVVAKATYDLSPGESRLAADQDEPTLQDLHWDNDARRSLCAASDLAPYKRRVDVLVVGHAHAPSEQPVSSLLCRVVAGDVDKSIRVVGDRTFGQDGQISEPTRFARMPLVWERAGGGPDTPNPVGVRADAWPDSRGRVPCPNLFAPGTHVTERGVFVEPVGLGPIAPDWPSRVEKLHHHAFGWDHRNLGSRPLPADIDPRYFNAAPLDQQLDELAADARIILENLHPELPRLVTSLAPLAPRAMAAFDDGRSVPRLRFRLDTLVIDADRGTCSLTFRAAMPLSHPMQPGKVTVSLAGWAAAVEPTTSPLPAAHVGLGLVLGASKLDSGEPEDEEPAKAEAPSPPSVPFPSERTLVSPLMTAQPPLPFRPDPEIQSLEDAPTFDDTRPQEAPVLPFVAVPVAAPRSAYVDLEPVLPFVPAGRTPAERLAFEDTSMAPGPVLPFVTAAPAPTIGQVLEQKRAPLEPDRAPPPMVGPPATPEAPSDEPVQAAAAPPPAPALPLDAYPLARCAAIAAAVAHRPPERARVLERHELTLGRWAELEEHYDKQLRAEAERGKRALLSAYDAAYVAELERLRGPIRVEEYAAILVAQERGQADRKLAELDLPRSALVRVQRVWLFRCAEDLPLGASVRGAVEDAREAD